MDFLLLVEDLSKAENILSKFAYQRTFKSENVAQYVSDLAPYGQIDVLIAFREISRGMLERRVVRSSDETRPLYTLLPSDLIGFKLQAAMNDPSREEREIADMKGLIEQVEDIELDWELLREYFSLFDRLELLEQIKNGNGETE